MVETLDKFELALAKKDADTQAKEVRAPIVQCCSVRLGYAALGCESVAVQ